MSPQIYILHGWSISNQNQQKWQPFIDALASHTIDAIFLNIPGLSAPLEEEWTLEDYVQWLDTKIPKNKSIILLGHSFGGQLAIRYTAAHPKTVKKLILIDSAGIIDQRIHKKLKRNLFYYTAKIGKPIISLINKTTPHLNDIFRNSLYKLARESDYKNANPLMRKVMHNVINTQVTKDAAQINHPTLILWGENDKITPGFMAEKYNRLIPNSQLQFIPQARHSPQYTHPQLVSDHINRFITLN